VVMTSRPGRIKLDQRVDLPYPRTLTTPGFRELETTILASLDDELRKTYGAAPALVSD
jgi:ABC-type nitrate/sulfonate/bicarbonate transport system ATPase subunit